MADKPVYRLLLAWLHNDVSHNYIITLQPAVISVIVDDLHLL